MPEKKIKEIFCRNRVCRKFLCFTDGEFLFVENLEIAPRLKSNKRTRASILKALVCPHCQRDTIVGLKAAAAKLEKPQPTDGRKFLIFRSRFD